MAQAAPAIPTLRDELDRKVFETIDYLVGSVSRGRMTKEQAAAGLETLFMAVNGLLDQDFIQILTEAQSVVGGDKSPVKKHYTKPGLDTIQTVSWVPGQCEIVTCKRESGLAVGGSVKKLDSVAAACRVFNGIGEGFEKAGWVEL